MFSFFRRQGKKNDKKQKGQQSGTKLINDIQCVPVEKYEIAFTTNKKPLDKVQEPAKRSDNFGRAMGSIESSPQKPEEKSNYQSASVKYDHPANHVDNNNVASEKSRVEPVWVSREKVDSQKEVPRGAPDLGYRSQQVIPLQKEVTTDSSKPSKGEVTSDAGNPTTLEKWSMENAKPVETSKINIQHQTSPKTYQETDSTKCDALPDMEKSNARQMESSKTVESSQNNVQTGNVAAEMRKITSECSADTMTISANQDVNQRRSNAEATSSPSNSPTLGSNPSVDGIQPPLNQNTTKNSAETTETKIKHARDIFFNVEPKISPAMPLPKPELPSQSSVDEMEDLEADQVTEIAVEDKDPSPGDETRHEHSSDDHAKLMDPFSESQYSDSTRCSVDRFSESGRSTDSEMRSEDEDEFEEAQSKAKQLFRPCAVAAARQAKAGRMQIPDITITESSDSEGEGESESEFEMDCYRDTCYDRTFPTILYDITEVDEPFSDASDMEFSYSEDKRNIVHQESKFQDQIKTLKCELETKDSENMQLRGKINDLQRDITNKTWGMDRLHAELESFQKEADCVRKKLLRVEEDLNCYKVKNTELNEQLLKTFENETDSKKVSTLQNEIESLKDRIRDQHNELEKLRREKLELQAKLLESETDKREKIKTMQIALDETLKQKQKLQAHFEEEYEKLRTVHGDREQHLLDDFEWKLREVELTCKRKLEDKDKSDEEKIKQIRERLENEIAQLKDQLKEVEKIKSYAAEVSQLRGLTQEQERSLKMAMKATEQCHLNERCLNEEIDKLRSSLEKERNHLATVQGIHSREISEKDRKHSFKLEQQKNELNSQWEDKIRRETIRLKLDLEKAHREEKRSLQDEAKTKAEEQLKENEQIWEKKLTESKKELEILEQTLEEKEETYRNELLRLQTNSDRDMLELRRKLDKMDLSYQEQLEKMQEKHEQEMEALREEYEKKIQQSEQNWSQQISSTRATLELVKEQLQRENETQIDDLNKKYLQELEEQYEKLQQEKEEAVDSLQEKYNLETYELQNRLNEELKAQKFKEEELQQLVQQLRGELQEKSQNEIELQDNIDSLQETIVNLKQKMSNYESLNAQSEEALKKRDIEYNTAMDQMKERYETELKDWHSKLSQAQTEAQTSDKINDVPCNTEVSQSTSMSTSQPSKSSRRKNRGKHRHQRNAQHQKLLEKQFSSSSL